MDSAVAGELIAQTIVVGSLYALVGVGFVILFRSTGVVNFAQGTFMVLGAYCFYSFFVLAHQAFVVALLLSMLIVTVVGVLANRLLFRRLIGADLFIVVVATMGLSLALQTVILIVWGPNTRVLPDILTPGPLFGIWSISFTRLDTFTGISAIMLIVVLEVLLRRTRLGIGMRAVADSTLLAALQRVNVARFSGLAWAIAALCSALAGIALAMRTAVDPVNIGALGLLIFPVVIIGGVDSIGGALVGGLIVAAIQNLTSYYLGGAWVAPVAYGLLLVVLLVRPRGLFGTREIVRI